MKAWIALLGTVALIGCADRPAVVSDRFAPVSALEPTSFAIEVSDNEAARAAVPAVVRRLASFGFKKSSKPDWRGIISASERSRTVGAFAPSDCDENQRILDAGHKWLIGGGRTMSLQILFVDARSGRTLYRSSSVRRTSNDSLQSDAEALVNAALLTDPRRTPMAMSGCH